MKRTLRTPRAVLAFGASVSQLVSTAWAVGGPTFRGFRQARAVQTARAFASTPQNGWDATSLPQLAKVLKALEGIQSEFNTKRSPRARRLARPT
jgi:catalase-peroxidase